MNKSNIIKAIILSPLFTELKKFHSPLSEKEELLLKCYNDGLYHITKEENLINILESGYLKASSKEISYGNEKVFLFAGIPSFEDVCFNISLKEKLVAIKINPTFEDLETFVYRSKNDDAIAFEGNLDLTDKLIEISYLGLYKENDNFIYKTISKEEYDNYKVNFDNRDFQNNFIRQLKAWLIGSEQQYKYTINYFNNLINSIKDNISNDFQSKKK